MKRKLALLLAAAMVAGALSACGNSGGSGTDGDSSGSSAAQSGTVQDESGDAESGGAGESAPAVADGDRPTISFFDKNSGIKAFDDRIAVELQNRTGVNINLISPTGDPGEKLSLMLAGQDYPDIILMDRGSDIVNKYIEAGALVNLSEHMDKLPNVVEMYGDTLKKIRYTDGNNYYLSNWYGPDPDPVGGFIMRYDLMVDLLGQERADSDEPFTYSEMVEVLKQFKEKYPTLEGKDSIALTIGAPGDNDNINGTFAGMWGMKTYYEDGGKLYYRVRDPRYMEAIHAMNDLYRAGLLDKEWVTNKDELRNQRLSAGNMFGYVGAYWDVWTPNASLNETIGEDANYLAYKVVADGVDPDRTTLGGRSSLGWDAIAITNNCENLDAALAFVDYCASQEGQDLLLWGIEGEDYTIENGVHTPIGDIVERFKADNAKMQEETGITRWTWFVRNANHEDGTPSRISMAIKDITAQFAEKNLTNTYWDTAEFDNLVPTGNDPIALKAQKLQDIIKQAYPNMVNASSPEEVDSIYEKMMGELEAAGLEEVEEKINENYAERMVIWNQ